VKKVSYLDQLFTMYRTNVKVKASLESPNAMYTSYTVLVQVKWKIANEIVQLEAEILSEIDKLVYNFDKIGRDKPIALWVCLWTLIIGYKSHVIYHKAAIQDFSPPDFSPQDFSPSLVHPPEERRLYELTRHIFNTLTSIYAALYKTTSPLTLDWRTKEVSDMLGNDQELISLFCDIKTEMFWFRKCIGFSLSIPPYLTHDRCGQRSTIL
jgi:hypothetical protein